MPAASSRVPAFRHRMKPPCPAAPSQPSARLYRGRGIRSRWPVPRTPPPGFNLHVHPVPAQPLQYGSGGSSCGLAAWGSCNQKAHHAARTIQNRQADAWRLTSQFIVVLPQRETALRAFRCIVFDLIGVNIRACVPIPICGPVQPFQHFLLSCHTGHFLSVTSLTHLSNNVNDASVSTPE